MTTECIPSLAGKIKWGKQKMRPASFHTAAKIIEAFGQSSLDFGEMCTPPFDRDIEGYRDSPISVHQGLPPGHEWAASWPRGMNINFYLWSAADHYLTMFSPFRFNVHSDTQRNRIRHRTRSRFALNHQN